MQFVPVAQAVTTQAEGPWMPSVIAICPVAMLAIIIGMKNGLIFDGPLAKSFSYCTWRVCIPPIPAPTKTPVRSRSIFSRSSAASLSASLDAATANCAYLSIRLDSFLSIKSSGLKSLTSPAICELYSVGSNCVIRSIPFRPSRSPDKKFSLPIPIGVIAPKPVTTTLFPKLNSPFIVA